MYHSNMIKKAKELSRNQRNKLDKYVRGVYQEKDDDVFDSYLIRYSSGVITLETALSIYGLTDFWINPPYDFAFQYGYRKINDERIRQFKDDKKLLYLGAIKMLRNNIEYFIYNKERLLIEIWRKEKYIPRDIYKQAIFAYRQLANSGDLNIPLLKEYIAQMPKSNIYKKRLSLEVL